MKNLKIGIKMALGIGIILLLVFLNGVYSIKSLTGIDDGMTSIEKKYLPLAELAAEAQNTLKDVPATMNTYLLTGQKSLWESTQAELVKVQGLIGELNKAAKAYSEIDTELGKELVDKFKLFETNLRNVYATNEAFIVNRVSMIPIGLKISKKIVSYKTEMLKSFKEAHAQGDLTEMALRLQRLESIDAVSSIFADIRGRMLRSLAAQQQDDIKENLKVLFPRLFAQMDIVAADLKNPAYRELLGEIRKNVELFHGKQRDMLELWNKKDALNKQREEAREQVLGVMGKIAEQTSHLQHTVVAEVSQAATASVKLTFGVCAVVLLLGLLIGILLTRAITSPMAKTLGFAQSVAAGS